MADEARFCEDEVPSEDESGVLFYVNKDGFPIGKKTWERMWRHVEKIHPKGAQMVHSVRSSQQLVKVTSTMANVLYLKSYEIKSNEKMCSSYSTFDCISRLQTFRAWNESRSLYRM